MARKARGNEEIEYGDLCLSKIDTGTQDSSFDISSIELRIQEQSLSMYIFEISNSSVLSAETAKKKNYSKQ